MFDIIDTIAATEAHLAVVAGYVAEAKPGSPDHIIYTDMVQTAEAALKYLYRQQEQEQLAAA